MRAAFFWFHVLLSIDQVFLLLWTFWPHSTFLLEELGQPSLKYAYDLYCVSLPTMLSVT